MIMPTMKEKKLFCYTEKRSSKAQMRCLSEMSSIISVPHYKIYELFSECKFVSFLISLLAAARVTHSSAHWKIPNYFYAVRQQHQKKRSTSQGSGFRMSVLLTFFLLFATISFFFACAHKIENIILNLR